MWRGLAALLPSAPEPGQSTSGARWIAPTVVKWIGAAREDEYLPADYQVRLRTVGMEYGSQSATSAEIIDDAVAMAVVVLQDSAEFAGTAIAGVTEAEQGTVALGRLAGNLAAAAGGDRDGPRDRAQEIAYAELDRHFRSWLATIHPDSDPQALRRSWHIAANRVLRTLGDELIEQAGPIAWVGRQDNNQHVSTPEAAGWFARSLRKTFELAYNHDQHHDSDPPTSPNPTRTQDDNTRSAPVTDKGAA